MISPYSSEKMLKVSYTYDGLNQLIGENIGGVVLSNPCEGIILPQKERRDITFYTAEQLNALLQAAKEDMIYPLLHEGKVKTPNALSVKGLRVAQKAIRAMARLEGFEPPAFRIGICCDIQLRHRRIFCF